MSMRRFLTTQASTKRLTVDGTGQSTALGASLTCVDCADFTPVSAEIRNRLLLDTPNTLYETFVDCGADIAAGDYITATNSMTVTNGKDYPIKAVEVWPWPGRGGRNFRRVVVELIP